MSILESKKITDVLSYVRPETLVLFDIDNTLVEPVQEFGSYTWFGTVIQRFEKQGFDRITAERKSSAAFTQIQEHVSFKVIEPDTVSVIEQLKTKNIKAMALTARWIGLASATCENLESMNISFQESSLLNGEMPLGEISGLSHGILFTGDEIPKGQFILSFFEKIGYTPKHVVFIDDSKKYIEDVHAALKEKDIACHCIRYGATDQRVAQFDSARAEKQLLDVIGEQRYKSIFGEIL